MSFNLVKLIDPIQMHIDGTFNPMGAYDNATDYAVGDMVDYNGSSYIMYSNAVAGTLPTDTSKWGLVASKGDPGPQGDPGVVQAVVASTGITVNSTDPANPEVALDGASQASLSLADTAVQDLSDLGITSTATELNYTGGLTSAAQTQLDAKVDVAGDSMTGQLRFPAEEFTIADVPIQFRYPDMTDGDSSKGGIIEWGAMMNGGTSYPYGIATQAYKDNPSATFTAPGSGDIYRKWAWVTAHYDSPSSTGEDVHQHFNIETVKADWLTAITRLQISFGEDVALVSFPNSNVKFYPDKVVQIGSDADGLYVEHDTSAARIDMTSTSPLTFNDDVKIGATETPGARLDVEESTDRNMLRLESTLGSANGSAQLLIKGTTAGGTAVQSGLTAEGTNRYSMNTSGRMEWGSGSATRDTNLYRNAADQLKTDDTLAVGGGHIDALTLKTGNYTLTATDYIVLGDTTSGSITLTLPTAASKTGQTYVMKKIVAANTLNIATTSSQTIDGSTSIAITSRYESITVVSDGSNWHII